MKTQRRVQLERGQLEIASKLVSMLAGIETADRSRILSAAGVALEVLDAARLKSGEVLTSPLQGYNNRLTMDGISAGSIYDLLDRVEELEVKRPVSVHRQPAMVRYDAVGR